MSAEHGTNTFTIELPEDVLTKFAEFAGLSHEALVDALRRAYVDVATRRAQVADIQPPQPIAIGPPPGYSDRSGRVIELDKPFSTEEAQAHYETLGRWKGPLAAEDCATQGKGVLARVGCRRRPVAGESAPGRVRCRGDARRRVGAGQHG